MAENINRRFFNVIHLLSYSIPIIAIQAVLLKTVSGRTLFFTKVLDTYEEIEDGTSLEDRKYTREDWLKRAKWTVDPADALAKVTAPVFGFPTLNYVKVYVAITVNGSNYMRLHRRTTGKSLLFFRIAHGLQDEAAALLDQSNITYVRKAKNMRLTVDPAMIEENAEMFKKIGSLIKKSWEGKAWDGP